MHTTGVRFEFAERVFRGASYSRNLRVRWTSCAVSGVYCLLCDQEQNPRTSQGRSHSARFHILHLRGSVRVWLNASSQSFFRAQEYLESKFGPAATEASGEEKRLTSEELWGAPIWNHDDPSGGLGNSTAG